jgi:hypothetical protein
MALAAPLLFIMLLGMMDFGRAFFQYNIVLNAGREGARFGAPYIAALSKNADASVTAPHTIQGRVQLAGGGLSLKNDATHIIVQYYDTHVGGQPLCAHYDFATNAIVWDAGYSAPVPGIQSCPRQGDVISVTVKWDFIPTTPLLASVIGGSIPLTAVAQTRIE